MTATQRAWILPLLLLASSTLACGGDYLEGPEDPGTSDLSGPYLGQQAPGLTPALFGPALIHATGSTWWHSTPGFSPDGRKMYWSRFLPPGEMEILFMEEVDGVWTGPDRASFDGDCCRNQPRFSNDGHSLSYIWGNHPGHVYRVDRFISGWSEPTSLGLPFPEEMTRGWQFSLAANGSIYVEGREGGGTGLDILRFQKNGDDFEPLTRLSFNSVHHDYAPFVAPDEDYLIFSSNRPGGYGLTDLWIVFKRQDGSWGDPVNMGPRVNSVGVDTCPFVTLDGKYLFFLSRRDGDLGLNPYWVSSRVIDSLRP